MDEHMLKEYLEKTYGYNEPIFINEIQLDNMNDNSMRQSFQRMVKSGAFLSNQIGLTTQMPAVIEIVTNRESTKGRTVTIGNHAVRLKRPAISISGENAELL